MSEQSSGPIKRIDVPDSVVIDSLREQLARKTDENVMLVIQLDFAISVIAGMQGVVASMAERVSATEDGHEHEHNLPPSEDE